MTERTLKEIKQKFEEAVRDYFDAIREDYNSREGDDSVRYLHEKRIIKIFKVIPAASKIACINHFLKQAIKPTGDERLTEFRCREAVALENKLEEISKT